jgi:hypothetical protein
MFCSKHLQNDEDFLEQTLLLEQEADMLPQWIRRQLEGLKTVLIQPLRLYII